MNQQQIKIQLYEDQEEITIINLNIKKFTTRIMKIIKIIINNMIHLKIVKKKKHINLLIKIIQKQEIIE